MSQVIFAEDETQLRGLIASMLASKGVTVAQAADGVEALKLVKNDPAAALLLSDIVMPNMHGYALVEESLKLRPELKVLLMTAYAADWPRRCGRGKSAPWSSRSIPTGCASWWWTCCPGPNPASTGRA